MLRCRFPVRFATCAALRFLALLAPAPLAAQGVEAGEEMGEEMGGKGRKWGRKGRKWGRNKGEEMGT
jgi:hypothetical protein